MSRCLNCGKDTPISSRTYKPKKYCDNKCANKFYGKDKRYSTSPQWDWGSKGPNQKKKMEQENQEKLSRLQELRETMVDRQEILDHFGISDNQSTYFANELGINSESVKFGNVQTFVFYSKEDAELLKDTIQERWGNKLREVPEGYISSEKIKDILGRKFILMRVFESSVEVVGHITNKGEMLKNSKQKSDEKLKS